MKNLSIQVTRIISLCLVFIGFQSAIVSAATPFGPALVGTPFRPSPVLRTSVGRIRPYTSGSYKVLHVFSGGTVDGAYPSGLVAIGSTYYGTTQQGGLYGGGVVFSIDASSHEHILHNFGSGKDGYAPLAGLVAVGTTLYGTTSGGGLNAAGTVFAVSSTTGSEVILHNFGANASDGQSPESALAFDGNNTFYGITYAGGTYNIGVLYSVTTSNIEKVLYILGTTNGDSGNPAAAGPLLYVNGSLYGLLAHGGVYGFGYAAKFTLSPRVTETFLYSFGSSTTDGENPSPALTLVGSFFYGTTASGGLYNLGSVFRLPTGGGNDQVMYSFKGTGSSDGAGPLAGLAYDSSNGNFYGTTNGGGVLNGYGGVLFQVTSSGAETVLHRFSGGTDGSSPLASPIYANGSLFGTTLGGDNPDVGTVYEYTP